MDFNKGYYILHSVAIIKNNNNTIKINSTNNNFEEKNNIFLRLTITLTITMNYSDLYMNSKSKNSFDHQ